MTTLEPTEPAGAQGRRAGVLRALFVLFCIAAAAKLAVLTMPPEEISPGGLPDHEEWRRGLSAQEWLDGPLLPYLDYQQGHFQGGTLLTIALDTISFGLFGGSPLTMRLPNLLYDWAAIAFLFLFLDRFASRRAAWIAGLLAAVPSPGYAMVGAIAWASHVEANAFAMAVLFLWARHVFGGADRRRDAFVLGVVAGLAMWFHYGLVVWLVPMLLVELFRDARAWIRPRMGVRLVGVLCGLTLWFVYNLRNDWKGLGVYGRKASEHFEVSEELLPEVVAPLFLHFLPHSLYLPAWADVLPEWGAGLAARSAEIGRLGGPARDLEFVLFALAALAWAVVSFEAVRSFVRHREVRPELVLALYVPLWTVLYVFSPFQGQNMGVNGYRYMLPLHPIAWICVGVVLSRRAHGVQIAAVGATLALMAAGTAHYLRPDRAWINANAPGHDTESVGRMVYLRALEDPDEFAETLLVAMERVVETRDPLTADVVLFTLGNCMLYGASAPPPASETDPERLARFAERARSHREALSRLQAAAPPQYEPYFTLPPEGERVFTCKWAQRDRFWRAWDRRGNPRPPGAYSH